MSNGLALPFSGTVATSDDAFQVTVSSGGGAGVAGYSWGTDGDGHGGSGVWGESDVGNGVFGMATKGGIAINGQAQGAGPGVSGSSTDGRGVQGSSGGAADGVYGASAQGAGMFGEGPRCGVQGKSGPGPGVFGENTAGGDGVQGRSVDGSGVAGISEHAVGVYGRGGTGRAGHFDGDVHVTGTLTCDTDIVLSNADCAEEFAVAEASSFEAGSVMVVTDDGSVRQCARAYDRRVVGVVSGAGPYRPALILDRRSDQSRTPIAVLGKVACRCDARFGPIEIGDMLTTSPTAGYAMRSSDPSRAAGAIIGKALGALKRGQGLVVILVSLQ